MTTDKPSDSEIFVTKDQVRRWLIPLIYVAVSVTIVLTRAETGEKVVAALICAAVYPILGMPLFQMIHQRQIDAEERRRKDGEGYAS